MTASAVRPVLNIIRSVYFLVFFFGIALVAQADTLYNFGGYDGKSPTGLVQASDGDLYGSAGGGNDFSGVLFRLTTSGTATILYKFSSVNASGVNADGAMPNPLVVGKDGNLYGTTSGGGAKGLGVFFKLSTSGQFTALASLSESPLGRLSIDGRGNFYGVYSDDSNNDGSLFGLNSVGKQIFRYTFPTSGNNPFPSPSPPVIGPDGAIYGTVASSTDSTSIVYRLPIGGRPATLCHFADGSLTNGLIVGIDGALYGTTNSGGANNTGQVFRITPAGVVTFMIDFGTETVEDAFTAHDAELVQASDGNLYGVRGGGANGDGVLFRVTPNSGIADIYFFTGLSDGSAGVQQYTEVAPPIQARDGDLYGTVAGGIGGGGVLFRASLVGAVTPIYSFPDIALPNALDQATDGNLYGTTYYGGEGNTGTVFRLGLDGILSVLYSFTPVSSSNATNIDGAQPSALIHATDGLLYGTTFAGGLTAAGTVFKLTTSGHLNTLHTFSKVLSGNADGVHPESPVVQGSDGSLYGTAVNGGLYNNGTVFQIKPDGSFHTLYSFTGGSDGQGPSQIALAPDGTLYGIAQFGATGSGLIYKITPDGLFSPFYEFTGPDGYQPTSLIPGSDGNLYGCCYFGGANGSGDVFKCDPTGLLTILYSFSSSGIILLGSNADGSNPVGLFRTEDGSLFVSASSGGTAGSGTILQIAPSLSATVIHTFGTSPDFTDGTTPNAVIADGQGGYVGTCEAGGANGTGMIFHLLPNGVYSDLFDFDAINGSGTNVSGADPTALVRINETYYGLSTSGGSAGFGVLFQMTAQGRFTKLRDLQLMDGTNPTAALLAGTDGSLYGGGQAGGMVTNNGTIFQATTQGVLRVLHDFSSLGSNVDGASPSASLIQAADGNFYGTTTAGGTYALGTIFKITPQGVLTTLYNFGEVPSDGQFSGSPLLQGADGALYGTTLLGGPNSYGTIFRMTFQGHYSLLYAFSGTDGAQPNALVQDADGSFYGTAQYGGLDFGVNKNQGLGTTFRLSTDSTLVTLHDFTGQDDGANPLAPLTLIPTASLSTYNSIKQGGRDRKSPGSTLRETMSRDQPLGMTGGVYHKIGNCMTGGVYHSGLGQSRMLSMPKMSPAYAGAGRPRRYGRRVQPRIPGNRFPFRERSLTSPVDGVVFEQNLDGSVNPLVTFNGQNGSNPQARILPASDGYYYGTTSLGGLAGGGNVFRLTLPIIDAVGPANPPVTKFVRLQVAGSGFAAGTQIAVNGKRVATQRVSTSLLTASVTLIAYAAPSPKSVTITVIAPDGTVSNAYSLPVAP